jgi:hypothetical protein
VMVKGELEAPTTVVGPFEKGHCGSVLDSPKTSRNYDTHFD